MTGRITPVMTHTGDRYEFDELPGVTIEHAFATRSISIHGSLMPTSKKAYNTVSDGLRLLMTPLTDRQLIGEDMIFYAMSGDIQKRLCPESVARELHRYWKNDGGGSWANSILTCCDVSSWTVTVESEDGFRARINWEYWEQMPIVEGGAS
jgi:hypothetical protein